MVVTEGQTGGAVGPAQRLLVPMHSNLTIIKYCNIVIKFCNSVIIIVVIIIVRMVVTELQTGGAVEQLVRHDVCGSDAFQSNLAPP